MKPLRPVPRPATCPQANDQGLMDGCWRVAGGSRHEVAHALYYAERKIAELEAALGSTPSQE